MSTESASRKSESPPASSLASPPEFYADENTVTRLAELCRGYGIAELSVFGSVARGKDRPGSDVDLLYVRAPGNDLGMSFFALQEDLEKLFGRQVDLVSKDGSTRSSAVGSLPTHGSFIRRE